MLHSLRGGVIWRPEGNPRVTGPGHKQPRRRARDALASAKASLDPRVGGHLLVANPRVGACRLAVPSGRVDAEVSGLAGALLLSPMLIRLAGKSAGLRDFSFDSIKRRCRSGHIVCCVGGKGEAGIWG